MKNFILIFSIGLLLFSCKNDTKVPDVSNINVDLKLERFDRDFFAIDTNNIPAGLYLLSKEHPEFYPDYMQGILRVDGSITDTNTIIVTKEILKSYSAVFDSIQLVYNKIDWLKKDLDKAFQFVKYYFPNYKTGKAILFVGPFDSPAVATTESGIAIGLQLFAGRNFLAYQSPELIEMFPAYISRRFSKEYITANCMKAVVLDLFPDKSSGKPLIEQMVEKGKQWYLLDKFLPNTPDSIKTGYTQQQLDWCKENEGMIWTYIVKNEDLQSLNPSVLQIYIGESPFTQGFPPDYSPGNIGQWIGWQFIKKFAEKNPDMKPGEIMEASAERIITEAKYKPK